MLTMLWEDCAALPLFKGFSREQLRLLDSIFQFCQFPRGTRIFEQGKAAKNLYILTEGQVAVRYKPYDGPPLTVAQIEPGGVFGWSAALGRETYTSEAVSMEDCCAFRVTNTSLHRLCETHPEIGWMVLDRLAGVIAERLRNTHAEVLAMLTKGLEIKR